MSSCPFALPAPRPDRVVAMTTRLVLSPNSAAGAPGHLIRKNAALLIRDRLTAHHHRSFGVLAQRMEDSIRVCGDTRHCQSQNGAESGINAFTRQRTN
jgi:hypothetical protein